MHVGKGKPWKFYTEFPNNFSFQGELSRDKANHQWERGLRLCWKLQLMANFRLTSFVKVKHVPPRTAKVLSSYHPVKFPSSSSDWHDRRTYGNQAEEHDCSCENMRLFFVWVGPFGLYSYYVSQPQGDDEFIWAEQMCHHWERETNKAWEE